MGEARVKKWLNRFIKSLEKASKENFGRGRMDCCDLNKKTNNPNKVK